MKCEWSTEEREIPFTWDLESLFWKRDGQRNGWNLGRTGCKEVNLKTDSKIHIKMQRTPSTQNNFE